MQAGSTIWWTWEVEDAFRNVRLGDKNAMKTFSIKLSNQLNDRSIKRLKTPKTLHILG